MASSEEFYSQMVRLEAAETWARMAGRAALVAIWPVMRAAETRRAAIATVVEGSWWWLEELKV